MPREIPVEGTRCTGRKHSTLISELINIKPLFDPDFLLQWWIPMQFVTIDNVLHERFQF